MLINQPPMDWDVIKAFGGEIIFFFKKGKVAVCWSGNCVTTVPEVRL